MEKQFVKLAEDLGLNAAVLKEFMLGVVAAIESEGLAEHFKAADVETQVVVMKMCAARYLARQALLAKHLMLDEEANKAFKKKVLSMLVEGDANVH